MDFDPFFEAVIITISSAKLEVIVKVVRPEESFLAVRFASGSASIPSESITVVITLGVGATADGCVGQLLACKTIWPSQHKMGCGVGAIGEVGVVVVGVSTGVGVVVVGVVVVGVVVVSVLVGVEVIEGTSEADTLEPFPTTRICFPPLITKTMLKI